MLCLYSLNVLKDVINFLMKSSYLFSLPVPHLHSPNPDSIYFNIRPQQPWTGCWQVLAVLWCLGKTLSQMVAAGQEVNCKMSPGDERTNYRPHHTCCGFYWLIWKECEGYCGSYIATEDEAREKLFSVFFIGSLFWILVGLQRPKKFQVYDT